MAVTERAHRRDQLLDTAAVLFSERGYHGTSMQDLAQGLGILRGSIYAHIASKEDLLFEIVDTGADRFLERMQRVAESDVPAAQKLKAAIEAHLETVAEHLEASTVFLNEWKHLSPKRRKSIERKRGKYQDMVRALIEEGVASGEFDAGLDPKFAALMTLSTMNWVYQWYRRDGAMTPGEIAEVFSGMVLKGFYTQGKTTGART